MSRKWWNLSLIEKERQKTKLSSKEKMTNVPSPAYMWRNGMISQGRSN